MAYTLSFGERNDERYYSGTTPRDDTSFTTSATAARGAPVRTSSHNHTLSDARASLQRRFTTNNVPIVPEPPPLTHPRVSDQPDWIFSERHRLFEQRLAEYELLKKKKQAFQNEMDLIDARTSKLEEDGLTRLQQDHSNYQSEPTTPPEYRTTGFPTALSKPNRYSTSTIASPPGLLSRNSRAPSYSQTTSPPTERAKALERSFQALSAEPTQRSLSSSRRNSDDEVDDNYSEEMLELGSHRAAALHNRNSMPITGRDRRNRNGIADIAALGHLNPSAFLFKDEDEDNFSQTEARPGKRTSAGFLEMNMNDKDFPTLAWRESDGRNRLSTMSADLDSQALQMSRPESQMSGWGGAATFVTPKHLSMNALDQLSALKDESPTFSVPSSGQQTPTKQNGNHRHSMGTRIGPFSEAKRPGLTTATSIAGNDPSTAAPKLLSSWSTNDIPTIKSTQSIHTTLASVKALPTTTAEQRLHNHNASLGRIPMDAVSYRNRDIPSSDFKREDHNGSLGSQLTTGLQGSTSTYGPSFSSALPTQAAAVSNGHPAISQFGNPSYYGGYNMQMLTNAMGNAQLGGNQPQWNSSMHMYQMPYNAYTPQQSFGMNQLPDSQARVIQQRRSQNGDDGSARFATVQLEDLRGEIYSLCKDQHGCRFLQKKLDERKKESIEIIFQEIKSHMIELMTDPFGNYLCQKLLECTDDDQRTALINNAAPEMVSVALNQHGTRALQKMIEFVSTAEQVQVVTRALAGQVVPLIQDLNGNHVIQKCLNRLSPEDAQFIFDAVGTHCVVVGTHRHGCCVIQRCIDHSSGNQKNQLVAAITGEALSLVQDPFGNYVVQYILDLGEASFSQPICRRLLGSIAELSRQKFSSNVIEKCIRIADSDTKHLMIEELLDPQELERLLRDSYANYVIQTAMDFADGDDKIRLFENARPLMASVRHTPYGRRIAAKIQDYDTRLSSTSSTAFGSVNLNQAHGAQFAPMAPRPLTNQSASAKKPQSAFIPMLSDHPNPAHLFTTQSISHNGARVGNTMNAPIYEQPPAMHGSTQQPFFPYGRNYPGMNPY